MTARRVNVRGIIFKDGRLLVTKFRQSDDSESKYWGTFGGGLDVGESFSVGLHREMIEETGVAPEIGKLLFMQQFNDGEKEHLELFFHIKNTNDYADIKLEETSHGIRELVRQEFVEPKANFILPAFLSKIDIQAHIDGTEPVFIHNELV
jgi:8-oxo-dGTP diphosphatase